MDGLPIKKAVPPEIPALRHSPPEQGARRNMTFLIPGNVDQGPGDAGWQRNPSYRYYPAMRTSPYRDAQRAPQSHVGRQKARIVGSHRTDGQAG